MKTKSGWSKQEQAILALMLVGLSFEQIAHITGLAFNTVKFYVKNIYQHMNVSSRNELDAQALFMQADSHDPKAMLGALTQMLWDNRPAANGNAQRRLRSALCAVSPSPKGNGEIK